MSNKIKFAKKRKKKGKQTRTSNNVTIPNSKFGYGIYRLLDSVQFPKQYGNTLLINGQTAFVPKALAQSKVFSPVASLEDTFIEVKPGMDLTNKKVLIIRNGGIGDILASLFGIIELKRKFKNIEIGYLAEFKNFNFIDGFQNIIDFPAINIIPYDKIKRFTHIVYLDDLVETRNDKSVHEIFADTMNVNIYPATLKTLQKYFNTYSGPRNGIGIQYRSNAVIRNYNIDLFIDLINKIHTKYSTKPIYLLGAPDDFLHVNYIDANTNCKIISNGCGDKPYDILGAFQVIQQLDMVIACDSSMTHIAGLTDTPMIGLFGPFHTSKRLNLYNNAIGINGKTHCSPCNRHEPQSFCPYTNGEAICVNSITPELIMDNVAKLIGIKNDT